MRNYAGFSGVPTTNLKVNMFKNKTIFASTLSDQFRTSSNWRKAQAKRFVHDARNVSASVAVSSAVSCSALPTTDEFRSGNRRLGNCGLIVPALIFSHGGVFDTREFLCF
jgi:hypothetical protein